MGAVGRRTSYARSSGRQGLRMKDAGEDLLHVSVIPCGHFATPLEAGL